MWTRKALPLSETGKRRHAPMVRRFREHWRMETSAKVGKITLTMEQTSSDALGTLPHGKDGGLRGISPVDDDSMSGRIVMPRAFESFRTPLGC
jgi:hypothetical protein